MPKTRVRPRPEDAAATPPLKRRKGMPEDDTKGFAGILLDSNRSKPLRKAHITESRRHDAARVADVGAVVNTATGHGDVEISDLRPADVVDISSDSSSSDEEEEEDVPPPAAKRNGTGEDEAGLGSPSIDGSNSGEALEENDEMETGEEPSFGEMLRKHNSEPVDVEAELAKIAEDSSDELQVSKKNLRPPPSGATFITVLSQALRTNDSDLLESCLDMHNLEAIRDSISHIDSRLTGELLKRLSELISARPGRLGRLMVWIQWIIISHGGYLATQRDIVREIGALLRIIKERAAALQPLLQLKGKLDMLSTQVDERRADQERIAKLEEFQDAAVTRYHEADEDEAYASDENDMPLMAIEDGRPGATHAADSDVSEDNDDLDSSDESEDAGRASAADVDEEEDEDDSD